jgi:V/A-type H+-transporting ATPase subunit E
MSLETVIQRVLDKGTAEKTEAVDAAKKEMEKLLRETREKGQQDISTRLDEARRAAERLRVQETARAELESRKIVLTAQKELLDTVRTEVLRRLGSPETGSEFVRTLLAKSETDWRIGKVFCSPADEKQVRQIVGSRFGGTMDCIGGVVIESDDGTRRIDLRFETLLQDIWEDSVKELADILWPRH